MAAEALIHRWSVGEYTVTLTCPRPKPGQVASFSVEWSPGTPRGLSPADWADYRRGRDTALAEISRRFGVKAVVVEV